MKKINHLISALIMAAMTAGFASCSSSDEPSSVSDNTPKELTITIKTQGVTTKAAASVNDPGASAENTMNRITIGIFDNTGNNVRAIQEFSKTTTQSDAGAGTSKFYYNSTNNTATATVVTTQMTSGDLILVAVNAPANKFAGITKASDFKDVTLTANEALYTLSTGSSPSDNKAVNDNIPMFGENTVSSSGSNTDYTASIQVKHLTAKVTLDELKVDFAADGPYSDASFTPTEIFLYSVPEGLLFDDSSPYLTSPTYYTGETGASGALTVKDFLSSGSLPANALDNSSSNFGTTYYFYTTTNDNVSANKTKLVIKGNFKTSSSDQGSIVYYPVKLNSNVLANGTHTAAESGSKEYQVSPNKNYKCSVTIKTIGSTKPDIDIDPTTAEITITVKDFEAVNQTTVFQ